MVNRKLTETNFKRAKPGRSTWVTVALLLALAGAERADACSQVPIGGDGNYCCAAGYVRQYEGQTVKTQCGFLSAGATYGGNNATSCYCVKAPTCVAGAYVAPPSSSSKTGTHVCECDTPIAAYAKTFWTNSPTTYSGKRCVKVPADSCTKWTCWADAPLPESSSSSSASSVSSLPPSSDCPDGWQPGSSSSSAASSSSAGPKKFACTMQFCHLNRTFTKVCNPDGTFETPVDTGGSCSEEDGGNPPCTCQSTTTSGLADGAFCVDLQMTGTSPIQGCAKCENAPSSYEEMIYCKFSSGTARVKTCGATGPGAMCGTNKPNGCNNCADY